MTPGAYLRHCRQEAAITLLDLALGLNSEPAVSAHERAEWLRRIEEGIDPLGCITARALAGVPTLPIDPDTLAVLMDRAAGIDVTVRLRPAYQPAVSAA